MIFKIMPVFCSETMYTVKVILLTIHCLTCVMYMYKFFLIQTSITVSVLTCSLLLLFLSPTLKIKTLLFYSVFLTFCQISDMNWLFKVKLPIMVNWLFLFCVYFIVVVVFYLLLVVFKLDGGWCVSSSIISFIQVFS